MKRLSLSLLVVIALMGLFLTLSPRPSLANPLAEGDWFRPIFQGPEIVNPYLTPRRFLSNPQSRFGEQLVLWEGRVRLHQRLGEKDYLLLATEAGQVPIYFAKPTRNLEFDRTGFRVAVKGKIDWRQGQFQGLQGQSCILLEPPASYSYPVWQNGRIPSAADFIAWRILFHNPTQKIAEVEEIAQALVDKCQDRHLELALTASLIQIESAWDVEAVSRSGAQGLGQLMPRTAAGLGVGDALDPIQNLEGCTTMVANLVERWRQGTNPYASVLASYNAGPTLVRSRGGVPPLYAETNNYIYFIGYLRRDLLRLAQKYAIPGLE